MKISEALRIFGLWAHYATAKSRPLSWAIHGAAALPFIALVAVHPWTAPGAMFLYREAEQVWHRWINKQGLDPLDHVMDVVVPGIVGWLFLA